MALKSCFMAVCLAAAFGVGPGPAWAQVANGHNRQANDADFERVRLRIAESAQHSSLRVSYLLFTDPRTEQINRAIFAAMQRHVVIDASDKPLSEVIEDAAAQAGIGVFFDQRALDDLGIESSIKVSFHLGPIRLQAAFDMILKQYDLTWMIDNDVTTITTKEQAEARLITRVYPVRDLVWIETPTQINEDYRALIDLIMGTIGPDTWDTVGGPGTLQPFPLSTALVISQASEVHPQVETLLTTLRRIRRDQGIAPIVPEPTVSDFDPQPQGFVLPAGVRHANTAWQFPRIHQKSE